MEFRCEKYPRLRVEAEGVSVRFEDGVYETDDEAAIDALKANGHVEAVEAEKPKRQRKAKPKAEEPKVEDAPEGESPVGAAEAAETEE